METDTQRTNQENLDFLAAPLEPSKREALELVCIALGLDREAFEQIEFEARMLRDFETHGKARLKTPREKIKTLQKVEEIANALHEAMQELDSFGSLEVGRHLPPALTVAVGKKRATSVAGLGSESSGGIVAGTTFPDLNGEICYPLHASGALIGRVGHISLEVKNVANAAREERFALGAAGLNGGRKATLPRYAWHIGQIWEGVKDALIPLGRGGKFETLCKAVFKAADIHANPEGAIREFLRWGDPEATQREFERSFRIKPTR
jgi:hypothetical protein